MKNLRILLLAGLSVLLFSATASADVFVLGSGGRIEGELVNAEEKPRVKFVVRTAPGATITLAATQVKDVVRTSPVAAEYEALRHKQPDTAAGHMTLANWCRDNKLEAERKLHLERVVELDAEHREARGQLGYSYLGGQWRTRTDFMASLGKVQHKGEWMYPQEIEILQRRDEATKVRQQWVADLRRWRDWLGGPKDQTARQNIETIADPAALPALQQALNEEQSDDVRVMILRAIARIDSFDGLLMLAQRALTDPSEEVRATSLDLLVEAPQPAIVNYFMQQLHSKDNAVVNRAAYGLMRFKDERAIGPLIDALVTSHKFAVTTGNPGGGINAGQGPGGVGLGMGGKTTIHQLELKNQPVLDALIVLSGGQANYTFNIEAWKQWFAGRKKHTFDARRG
jgi:HEAT repeat protein